MKKEPLPVNGEPYRRWSRRSSRAACCKQPPAARSSCSQRNSHPKPPGLNTHRKHSIKHMISEHWQTAECLLITHQVEPMKNGLAVTIAYSD